VKEEKESVLSSKESKRLDLTLDFEEQAKEIKSVKFGRTLLRKSDNFWCLKAMFNGARLNNHPDDAPYNPVTGKDIYNVKSRISDLVNKYGIDVKSDCIEGSRAKEYWLE